MSIDKYIDERMRLERKKYQKKQVFDEHEEIKLLKASCPYCEKKIEYKKLKDWKGELRCPHCGKKFKVPNLDGFIN